MSHYESHHLEEEPLPFIFKECVARSSGIFPSASNWHENVEILFVTEGCGTVWDNGHATRVSAGDVFVFNANHLHSLGGEMHYCYLIVDRTFCLSNSIDTAAFSFDPFIVSDPSLQKLMEELRGCYALPDLAPLRTPEIRSVVLRLMLHLCRAHASPILPDASAEKGAAYVKKAIDYIRASYEKSFSLEDVAAFVGVNKCYLSREFHKYTGYRFVAYVNRTRCKMACRLLSDTDLPIGEIGRRCGFENRSYFARSFQTYIGCLPGEYRADKNIPHAR